MKKKEKFLKNKRKNKINHREIRANRRKKRKLLRREKRKNKKRPSKKGLICAFASLASILIFALILYRCYLIIGDVSNLYGAFGVMNFALAVVAFIYGLLAMEERKYSKIPQLIGMSISAVVIVGYIFLYILGMGKI